MKNYFLLPLFLFYCACSPSDSYLEKAGSNRPEITKVLDYYTNVCPDSLKLAAAVFLFTHMDGHYELSNDNYKKYVLQLDSFSLNSVERQLAKIIPVQYPFRQIGLLERRDDLEQISSSYLINHIDYVFGLWRNEPWQNKAWQMAEKIVAWKAIPTGSIYLEARAAAQTFLSKNKTDSNF